MNDYYEISQRLRGTVLRVPKVLQVLRVIEEKIGSEKSMKRDNQKCCNSKVCHSYHSP